MTGEIVNYQTLGRCENCMQTIYKTDTGAITGHLGNCPSYGQSP